MIAYFILGYGICATLLWLIGYLFGPTGGNAIVDSWNSQETAARFLRIPVWTVYLISWTGWIALVFGLMALGL